MLEVLTNVSPWIVWFFVGLVLLLAEFAIPGLIVVFFAMGAWLAAIVCLIFDVSLAIQLTIFLAGSILSLVFLRQKFSKLFKGSVRKERTTTDDFAELVGEHGVVIETIASGRMGKVEVRGTPWTAESSVELRAGQAVAVVERRGLTLIVKER